MTGSSGGTFDAAAFAFVTDALAAACAVSAAHDLGVLARLDGPTVDPCALARELAASERGLRALLQALVALGLAETTDDGRFRAAMPGLVRLADDLDRWGRLGEAIRKGQPALAVDTPAGAGGYYPALAPVLAAMLGEQARAAAAILGAPGLRVLDVAAGAAPWSLALVARDPDCRVTALDLPQVTRVTRRAVTEAGSGDRFDYLDGDVFEVELDQGAYDLVIVGNLCHLFGDSANRRLLRRLLPALRPGGRIAVIDVIPDDRQTPDRSVALYELSLVLRTSQGRVQPFSRYGGWLRDAGFEAVQRHDLPGHHRLWLVTAGRPT